MNQPLRQNDEPPPGGFGRGPQRPQPMFNLPAIVTVVLAIMWLLQILRATLLTPQQTVWLIFEGGFIPLRYSVAFADQSLAWVWTPVSYSLLHADFTHLIVNSVWLMAFGAVVARRIGIRRFLVFWILSAIVAAAFYWPFHPQSNVPMVGASGVVSGLMGAAARFAFPSEGGFNRTRAHLLPRVTVTQALNNRTVLIYVAIWFGINALAAFGIAPGAADGARIAWEAHVGGFLFGFLGFALFDRSPTLQKL